MLAGGLAALASGVVGCASGSDETEDKGWSDLAQSSSKRFDPNHLVEDTDILGGGKVTAAEVQSFLASKKSYLATYKEGGSSAAQIIVSAGQARGINPVYLLARIQGESSLVESGSSKNIAHATGCACPDGGSCAKAKEGFEKQVVCAADLIKSYLTDLGGAKKSTISGWQVGVAKKTLDPCTVKPANKATAALYTYTPWVGAFSSGCGVSNDGGSTGIAFILSGYKDAFPDASSPPSAGTDHAGDGDTDAEGMAGIDPATGAPIGDDDDDDDDSTQIASLRPRLP